MLVRISTLLNIARPGYNCDQTPTPLSAIVWPEKLSLLPFPAAGAWSSLKTPVRSSSACHWSLHAESHHCRSRCGPGVLRHSCTGLGCQIRRPRGRPELSPVRLCREGLEFFERRLQQLRYGAQCERRGRWLHRNLRLHRGVEGVLLHGSRPFALATRRPPRRRRRASSFQG